MTAAFALDPTEWEWREQAACRGMGTELFFPERGQDTKAAKAVCARCSVRSECLEVGMYEKFGLWAGLSERQRRRLRRALGIRLSDPALDEADEDDGPDEDEENQ